MTIVRHTLEPLAKLVVEGSLKNKSSKTRSFDISFFGYLRIPNFAGGSLVVDSRAKKYSMWVEAYRTGSGSDRVVLRPQAGGDETGPGRYRFRFRILLATLGTEFFLLYVGLNHLAGGAGCLRPQEAD